MSMLAKAAEEIERVLRYNPQLSQQEKTLSIELRLRNLAQEIEKSCAEASRRESIVASIIVDERPQDIPVLAEAMLARQILRGPAN